MSLVKHLYNYLSSRENDFLYCADRNAVHVASIKPGQMIYETIGSKIMSCRSWQHGYQVDFPTHRTFMEKETYRRSGIEERRYALFAFHQLEQDVILNDKVIPSGHYIVFRTVYDDSNCLEEPKAYSPQEFHEHFQKLGLHELQKIMRKFTPHL